MLGVYVTVPVACFRKGLAREYLETEPLPPPATCYGFLLSLVGETNRRRHLGVRVAPVLISKPPTSVVLRTVWRVKKAPLGSPGNTRPDYQQLLTSVELVLWLDSSQEAKDGLEARVAGGPPIIVTEDSPVAYAATFSYDAVIGRATFQFTPLIDDVDATQVIRENLFPGVVQHDDEALRVDYVPTITMNSYIVNNFELTLDKSTGQGHWRWYESCLICDRIFDPSAEATITSFREALGGDFDEDGDVDAADLPYWQNGFGAVSFVEHRSGDANADAVVDGADFLVWQRQLGFLPAAAVAVPEPYAAWLMTCVTSALILRMRRRAAVAPASAHRSGRLAGAGRSD